MAFNITGSISLNNSVPRERPNAPTNLVPTRVNEKMGRLTWQHTPSVTSPHNSFRVESKLSADTDWETLGTIPGTPANETANTDGSFNFNYDVINISDLTVAYDFRVFATSTIVGDMALDSLASDTVTLQPDEPTSIISFGATRPSPDVLQLVWAYALDGDPVRYFELQASETDTNNYATIATIDGGIDRNGAGDFLYDIVGNASENDTVFYRIRAVTLNGVAGDFTQQSVSPVAPRIPENLMATVNAGVGLVTSLSLTWTKPDDFATFVSGFLLEYRLTTSGGNWIPFITFPGNEERAETLPPQQGAVDIRLSSIGTNGLTSDPTPVISLTLPQGSATDDAIYNGDGSYIANAHFRVPADDRCLQWLPSTAPRTGLQPTITGGTIFPPTALSDGFIRGEANTDLTIEWTESVNFDLVNANRHFYLDLQSVIPQNNPTRVWDVDTGNVIIEVISDPTITNRFYEGPGTRNMYLRGGVPGNIRFEDDRNIGQSDPPVFVSRSQIRLPMRRVFTFRAAGLVTFRITFLADRDGFPRIPLPISSPNLTGADTLCLEAWSSEVTETQQTPQLNLTSNPDGTHTYDVVFDREYEEIPSVVVTACGPFHVWTTNKTTTGVTFNIRAILDTSGNPVQPTTMVNIDYTVRGY